MKSNAYKFLLIFIGCIPFAFWVYNYIDYDVWYDEGFSLKTYALVDFSTTLFYYPAPNNHIFFNLIDQIVSRVFGLRDINEVLDTIYVFRTVQLLISIAIVVYCFLLLKHFFKKTHYALVPVILFTTLPFLNFSLQLRGYNISALCMVMLLYYTFKTLTTNSKTSNLLLFIMSTLFLYTIPSNVYFLFSLWLIIAFLWWYDVKFKKNFFSTVSYKKILLCIALGTIAAFVLYFPVIENVIFNEYASRTYPGIFYMVSVVQEAFPAFLSARYLLIIPTLLGIAYLFKKRELSREVVFILILAGVLLVPFGVAFLHQKAPYSRVFVPLAPVFVLLFTVLISYGMRFLKTKKSNVIITIVIGLYCVGVFFYEYQKNQLKVKQEKQLELQFPPITLYRNYFLAAYYQPKKRMETLSKNRTNEDVVIYNHRDIPTVKLYLDKYQVPYTVIDDLESLSEKIKTSNTIIVLTSKQKAVVKELQTIDGIETSNFYSDFGFTNGITISKKKPNQ